MSLHKKVLHFIVLMCVQQQLVCIQQTAYQKKHIVFDPIFIVEPDMLAGIKNLGAFTLGKAWFGSWVGGPDPNELLPKFFEVLRTIDPRKPSITIFYQGLEAPYLLHSFLIGEKTPSQALSKNKKNRRGFDRKLLKRCAEMTFDPEKSANVMRTVSGIRTLLQELRRRGYTIHLLGNWNDRIFAQIEKKQSVLGFVNGKKLISGNLKMAKGSAMFAKLFDEGINPEQTIVIEPYPSVANELRSAYPSLTIIGSTDLKEIRKALKQQGIIS